VVEREPFFSWKYLSGIQNTVEIHTLSLFGV